jgi:hypothetical protein
MASWGYTDEHDGTSGEQPRGTVVSNNVCHELGVYQLQSSCWFQAKTAQTTVIKNLFFNGPRAGINMNELVRTNIFISEEDDTSLRARIDVGGHSLQ